MGSVKHALSAILANKVAVFAKDKIPAAVYAGSIFCLSPPALSSLAKEANLHITPPCLLERLRNLCHRHAPCDHCGPSNELEHALDGLLPLFRTVKFDYGHNHASML